MSARLRVGEKSYREIGFIVKWILSKTEAEISKNNRTGKLYRVRKKR